MLIFYLVIIILVIITLLVIDDSYDDDNASNTIKAYYIYHGAKEKAGVRTNDNSNSKEYYLFHPKSAFEDKGIMSNKKLERSRALSQIIESKERSRTEQINEKKNWVRSSRDKRVYGYNEEMDGRIY